MHVDVYINVNLCPCMLILYIQEHAILLVGASDKIVPPDQVLRTCQHTVAGVQKQLSQAEQRILHKEAKGVLQVEAHHRHQPVQLGNFVHLPARLVHVVRSLANTPQVGTDAVAQLEHPCLPKKQAYLEKEERIWCFFIHVKFRCLPS